MKVIKPDVLNSITTAYFVSEQQILSKLPHENIARMYDGGITCEGYPFLIIEYIDGVHLDKAILGKSISASGRITLGKKIISGVICAHDNYIVHRDLKPSNIIVTNQLIPKVLDFGISTFSNTDSSERPKVTPLTVSFASPEQLLGNSFSFTPDIYQVGIIMFFIFTE